MEIFKNAGIFFIDTVETLVVAAAIFVIVYLFIMQPHRVDGESMFPTFHSQDYILTEKISYRFGRPKRGDIVVFRAPAEKDKGKDFIKRIIALPGEKIKVENNHIYIYNSQNPNGFVLEESYLRPNVVTTGEQYLQEGVVKEVSDNNYVVMGDNRQNSSDSRAFGTVPKENLIGKAFLRYWPLSKFSLINGTSFKGTAN